MVRKLLLSRHGSTRWNHPNQAKEKVRGWVDLPLDDKGIIEGHKIAKELKGLPIDIMVSSDIQRAVQTAMIIHKDTEIPYGGPTMAFRPWNLGKFQGMESVKAAPFITKFAQEQPHISVPQGESFHDFERRFFMGLRQLFQSHQGLPLIITHYRCVCMLEAWQKAGSRPDGSIDHVEFCKKNNKPTGHIQEYDIQVEQLPQ